MQVIFLSVTDFSNQIQIWTVYFVSDNDIHHIWNIEIQLWISG
jgi:hypothetical protein